MTVRRRLAGCDHGGHAEPERPDCGRAYLEAAAPAVGLAWMDRDKRVGFDAAARVQEARRAARTRPPEDLWTPCTGVQSNLGLGCLAPKSLATGKPP